jgi:hypothetical protein
MKLTNTELREIKKLVDMGLGLRVSFPKRTEPQVLTVYKTYTVRPQEMEILGPLAVREIYRRSPGSQPVNARNLKPGNRLSPRGSKTRINNILSKINGKSPPPPSANKKSPPKGKRPRGAIR